MRIDRSRMLTLALIFTTAAAAARSAPSPNPPARAELVRPRLHLRREVVDSLKVKIRTEPFAMLFNGLKKTAEVGVVNAPPRYVAFDKTGGEQNWQRDVGNMIPELALMYLLTDDDRYLRASKAAMLASAGYPTWGLGKSDGLELAAAHQLYGLAVGYDWLHDRLDDQTRSTVRGCLKTRGQRMFQKLRASDVWWARRYLSNHLWVKITGLCAAGLALQGEEEGVDGWISLCRDKLRESIAALGPDGVSFEGLAYWSYGTEYLLKLMDLHRALMGEDLFHQGSWFANTASYRLYSMLPRNGWTKDSTAINFGDGPPRDYYGPDYILRKLAAEYRDPYAQWLAEEMDKAGLCSDQARFLNLLWYDPTVKPKPPADLPTFKHFTDMGLVVMRSGWSGDEAVLALRSGPHLGHHATLQSFPADPSAGHLHPDAGSLLLFAQGEWLIGPEINVKKTTEFENTVRVNGMGQMNEGGAWTKNLSLLRAKTGAGVSLTTPGTEIDYVAADAASAYPPEAGLRQFLRHIIYVKPSCWVLVDELRTGSPSRFEWSFHSMLPFALQPPSSSSLSGPRGSLTIQVLDPPGIDAQAIRGQVIVSDKISSNALVMTNHDKADRIALIAVLYAYPSASPPRLVAQLAGTGATKTLHLEVDGRSLDLALDLDRTDPSAPIFRRTRSGR